MVSEGLTATSLPYTDLDLVEEFVGQSEAAASTLQNYRAHLTEFATWLAQHGSTLHAATPADVHRFMAYLRTPARARASRFARGDELSPSTRKQFLAALRGFYRYAILVGIVPVDPTAAIRSPRVTTTPGVHLSPDEIRRLLDAPGSARDRVQAHLLAYTAARAGELRDLRWSDVDFPNAVVRLRGKGSKVRFVDIHPALMVELRKWWVHQEIESQRSEALARARENEATDYVLLTRTGRQVSATAICKQLKRRACLAGLHALEPAHREYRSRVSPHALRRSFATYLLNEGHGIDAVADVLGHASIDTTRRHYAFSSSERRRATVRGFNP
jgi:site-specific recombinase XerD